MAVRKALPDPTCAPGDLISVQVAVRIHICASEFTIRASPGNFNFAPQESPHCGRSVLTVTKVRRNSAAKSLRKCTLYHGPCVRDEGKTGPDAGPEAGVCAAAGGDSGRDRGGLRHAEFHSGAAGGGV